MQQMFAYLFSHLTNSAPPVTNYYQVYVIGSFHLHTIVRTQ